MQPRGSLLIHASKRLDLEFERLRILPLDLHFRLQFLDEEIEPGDFRTQFLDVGNRWSRTARRRAWLLQILLRSCSITRTGGDECFGEGAWPN